MQLTGEAVRRPANVMIHAAPQPGARPPAPGELAVLQAFLNTRYDLAGGTGAEVLSSPSALGGWLQKYGLLERPATLTHWDLQRVLTVREGLYALLRDPLESEAEALALNRALEGASLELELSPAGPRLSPGGSRTIDRALARIGAILVQGVIDERWRRLKVCPGPHCGWVFYDHSRNRSSRWCSMRVCGGRVKAKAHYRREREVR